VGKTVAELSSELEVTAKTIRRDLAVFHDAGFPIEESAGPTGRKSHHIASGSGISELGFMYDETGSIRVTIRFSSEVARYVEESQWHSSQQCALQLDGSRLVRIDLSGTTEVKSWVLGFGRHAEVVEPGALRDEFQDELASTVNGLLILGSPGNISRFGATRGSTLTANRDNRVLAHCG